MLSGNSRKKGSKVANTDNKHKESNAAILGQRVEDTPRGSVEAVGVDSSVPILSSDEQLALKVLHTSTKEPVQIAGSTNLTSDSFDEQVYSYRSAPKSAERRVPPLVVSEPYSYHSLSKSLASLSDKRESWPLNAIAFVLTGLR